MARPVAPSKQRGIALMLMLAILVLGVAAALLGVLRTTSQKHERAQATAAALAQAKAALIGYAISYGDKHPGYPYGYLPCPDVDEAGITAEGAEHGNCGVTDASAIGRLPWKTLGLPIPRDAAAECLWYAVSGSYKNNPKSATAMNWDNTGKLRMYAADGGEILADEVVAVVIAPGPVLPNHIPLQDRSGTAAPLCGGNYTATAYLDHDTVHNIDNADIATSKFILPHQHRDAAGNTTSSVNDQFVYITRSDIWQAIQRRIAQRAKTCLDDYAASAGGKYPWAAPVTAQTAFTPLLFGEYNTLFGRLPVQPVVLLTALPASIKTLQTRVADFWTALTVFAGNRTSANLTAMKTSAGYAKNIADSIGDSYEGTSLGNAADSLKDAADDAQDHLTTSSSQSAIAAIQQRLTDAGQAFTAALPAQFSPATGMPSAWPASCTLFSSAYWEHWKDLVFYQVATGFRPGGGGSCDNCLSITADGVPLTGSGSYHGVVIAAGKKLTQNRSTTQLSDYLEADNLLPQNDPDMPYLTYRPTEGIYPANNDFVLCLDGRVNCK